MEKECIDWHYIKYEKGTCDWYDFQDQFEITRHSLRFSVPLLANGDVDCEKDGQRAYPRCDYSKGFPDWWWLDHVDIQVPSNHVQEGKRYDAEVRQKGRWVTLYGTFLTMFLCFLVIL
jgi:hypothetical protein